MKIRLVKLSRSLHFQTSAKRVHCAFALNPDLSPFGAIPLAGEGEGMGGAGVVSEKLDPMGERRVQIDEQGKGGEEVQEPLQQKKSKKKSPKVKHLTPNAIVQRMKFGETGVSVQTPTGCPH